MNTPTCEGPGCTGQLGARHSHRARYCSTRCRVAGHRAKRRALEAAKGPVLPAELTGLDRWVRRDERKAPRTIGGGFASVVSPSTWSSYADACASTAGAGLGFVLAEGDGIVCVDLDHCLEDGVLAPWARHILESFPLTFTEVSASGTGLHIWGRGQLARGRRIRRDGMSVEVYGQRRYIAVTGTRFERSPLDLADLGPAVSGLEATLDARV